jgi:hypothetical protein
MNIWFNNQIAGLGVSDVCWIRSVPNPSDSSKRLFFSMVASLVSSYALNETISFTLSLPWSLRFFVSALQYTKIKKLSALIFEGWLNDIVHVLLHEKKRGWLWEHGVNTRPGDKRWWHLRTTVINRNILSGLHCCWMQTNLKIELFSGTEDSAHCYYEHRQFLSQPAHRGDW